MKLLQSNTSPLLGYILRCRFYSKQVYPPVSHVIFDLDGTILDTEVIYTQIYTKVLKKYDKIFDNEIHLAILGASETDAYRILVETFNLPIAADKLSHLMRKTKYRLLADSVLKPGAERVIRHLSDKKVPIAVATNSGEESFWIKTSKHSELFSLFHHVVIGSSDPEVGHGKPAPDIFRVAAKRFLEPADPKKCLVFEDSPNGVKSARSAGMQVVMIPEAFCPVEKTKEATLVIKSFEHLEPEQFGLPAYHWKL